jgi:hypothetical protein
MSARFRRLSNRRHAPDARCANAEAPRVPISVHQKPLVDPVPYLNATERLMPKIDSSKTDNAASTMGQPADKKLNLRREVVTNLNATVRSGIRTGVGLIFTWPVCPWKPEV